MLENPILCPSLKKNKSLTNILTLQNAKPIVFEMRYKSKSSSFVQKKKTVSIKQKRKERKDSPEIEQKKSFHFSRRNFYPRQILFNAEKKKVQPF